MDFQAKSEEQIARDGLLAKSEYDFEVLTAADTTSKTSGASMIALDVMVYTGDGGQRKIKDYLLAKMAAKLRHFCDATGLLKQYERGALCAADCEGRTGRCKVDIQEDKSGQYPPKNVIRDYCVRPAKDLSAPSPAEPTAAQAGGDGDTGLPF